MTESDWKKFWKKWDDIFSGESDYCYDYKGLKKEFCALLKEEEKKAKQEAKKFIAKMVKVNPPEVTSINKTAKQK